MNKLNNTLKIVVLCLCIIPLTGLVISSSRLFMDIKNMPAPTAAAIIADSGSDSSEGGPAAVPIDETPAPSDSPDTRSSSGGTISGAVPKITPMPSAVSNAAGTVSSGRVIVLDPGHGKSSGSMTDEEKAAAGWVKNSAGKWGEWRHWKSHTYGDDCLGSGCAGDKECWYPIGNSDRSKEPEINLRNALAAKSELEKLGYTVRLTRESNSENPSMSKRVSKCFNQSGELDAALFVCIHSNAGGGSGSAYIELSASNGYDQKYIPSDYVSKSNAAGKLINDKIVASTSLKESGGGKIGNEGYLVLFHKSPVPIAYMEIGFFDNSSDLSVLNSEYGKIGAAIAAGIDEYMKSAA